MNWLVKNIGLMALGICILASAAALEMRLASIESRLDSALSLAQNLASIQVAVPQSVLRDKEHE